MTPEQIVEAAAAMLRQRNPFARGLIEEIKLRFKSGEAKRDFGVVDLRRRPDGVWEMPE